MRFILWAVLAAAGLLVGRTLAPDTAAPPAPAAVQEPAPSTSATKELGSADHQAPAPESSAPAAPTSPAAVAAEPPSDPTALAAILAEYPERSYERGDGEIHGTVLDAAGVPVEGIPLELVVHGTTPGVDPLGYESPQLLGFIEEEIDQYHFDRAFMRRAVSAADGRFSFTERDPDWKYHVHAGLDHPGYVFTEGGGQQLSVGDTLVVRALPATDVLLEVVDGAGNSVPATVLWSRGEIGGEEQTLRYWVTEQDPSIRIPHATPKIFARTPTGESSAWEEIAIAGVEEKTIRIVVRGRSGLEVTLTGSTDPLSLSDLQVIAMDHSDFETIPTDWSEELWNGRRLEREGTNARSRLSAGRYSVLLCRGSTVLAERVVVVHESTVTELSLPVPPADASKVFFASVRTSAGEPLDGVQFEQEVELARGEFRERMWHGHMSGTPTAPGEYIVRIDDEWGEHEFTIVSVTVTATHDEFGRQVIENAVPGSNLEFVFTEPAMLWLELEEYVGHPLQGNATVIVGETTYFPDLRGWVEVGPIAPGPIDIAIVPTGFTDRDGAEVITLDVVPGPSHRRLAIPQFYELVVHFPEHPVGTPLWISRLDGHGGRRVEIGSDGRVRVPALPPGRYSVMPQSMRGSSMMTVTVPTGGEVVFESQRFDCLVVEVYDDSGWLARVGFRSGDRIVGVNGSMFEDLDELRFVFARAISAGSATIDVERAGATVSVPLPDDDPPTSVDLGGSLEPGTRGGAQ